MSTTTKPVFTRRLGPYSAAAFYQTSDSGKSYPSSVNLEKSYQKDGEWVTKKTTVWPAEIGCLIAVLQQIQSDMLTDVE